MQDMILFANQHWALVTCFGVLLTLILLLECWRGSRHSGQTLSIVDAVHMINHKQATLIDLRAKNAYNAGHVIHAFSIPLEETTNLLKKLEKYRDKPMILICSKGIAAHKTAADLQKQGYHTYTLAGGMQAWTAAGMPTVKDSRS